MERAYARRDQQGVQFAQVQEHITQELHSALLSETTTDTTTYFVGEDGNVGTSSGKWNCCDDIEPGGHERLELKQAAPAPALLAAIA